MASTAQYQALTDAQLAARRAAVAAMPASAANTAELSVIDAEIARRQSSTLTGYNPGSPTGGFLSELTSPIHEVSNTAMWTSIGIAAAAVAVIAIAIVVAYGFHRI